MIFTDKLIKVSRKNRSIVSVGLDSDPSKIGKKGSDLFLFNKRIIQATHTGVCSYKLNTAFYESMGHHGIKALKDTCDFLKENYPEIPLIIDAKRGDIGNTNNGYVQFVFTYLRGDAVTVNPYLGSEAIGPFLEQKDKGVIILCKTSNPGSAEFQDLPVTVPYEAVKVKKERGVHKLYQHIAYQVAEKWNRNRNCLLVVGATYPSELKDVRRIVGQDMWILVPGVGAQGGDVKATLAAGLNRKKEGLIINSSRQIIFSKDPHKALIMLNAEIEKNIS